MKYADPYEPMGDAAVDEEVVPLFAKHRPKSVLVSIRMPEELLERVKRLAQARETRYQTLLKRILEAALSQIEQEGWATLEEAAKRSPRAGAEEASMT
jgi:predicted DNA binding CopG/RHH family protein